MTRKITFFWYVMSCSLAEVHLYSSETNKYVNFHQTTWHHVPLEGTFHSHCYVTLKANINAYFVVFTLAGPFCQLNLALCQNTFMHANTNNVGIKNI
jgi:hypothetical protein